MAAPLPSGRAKWPPAGIQDMATMEMDIHTRPPGSPDTTNTRYSSSPLIHLCVVLTQTFNSRCDVRLPPRVRCESRRSASVLSLWLPRRRTWSQRVWWKWGMLGDGGRCATRVGVSTAAGLCAGCSAFQRLLNTMWKHTSEYGFLLLLSPPQGATQFNLYDLKVLNHKPSGCWPYFQNGSMLCHSASC